MIGRKFSSSLAVRFKFSPATICPGSSDPFYIVTYYIKFITTSWTQSINKLYIQIQSYPAQKTNSYVSTLFIYLCLLPTPRILGASKVPEYNDCISLKIWARNLDPFNTWIIFFYSCPSFKDGAYDFLGAVLPILYSLLFYIFHWEPSSPSLIFWENVNINQMKKNPEKMVGK